MAFVLADDTLRADEHLIVLTEVLGLLLGVRQAELLDLLLVLLLLDLLAKIVRLADDMHTGTDPSKVVHLLFVVDVVYSWLNIIINRAHLPRIVKFLISCLTSGENTLRQVGHVRMLLVLRSIRQI